jgi:hydroxymethylpyrimidine/phosphomethylpyrimidine kinase
VITAVTAQSDSRLTGIHHVPAEVIRAQIAAALQTRPVGAIKIGMLGTRATVDAVVDSLPLSNASIPLVLDPVLVSSSGGVLLDAGGRDAMLKGLFPRATLVTPNVPEAAALLQAGIAGSERTLVQQAQGLLALGPQAVLIKGGHMSGAEAVDLLISRSGGAGSVGVQRISSPRLSATRRGTGCALASAIAAGIAAGVPLLDACREAKRYVVGMLKAASPDG